MVGCESPGGSLRSFEITDIARIDRRDVHKEPEVVQGSGQQIFQLLASQGWH